MKAAKRKVLVADDHPDSADVTAELLRIAGFEAVATYDGLQAVQAARVFKPDLALLDIDMPGMDGYATARALRQAQTPGTRLVLIAYTGRTTHLDAELAHEAGFDRHVAKPLSGQALCDLIAAFLDTPVIDSNAAKGDSQIDQTQYREHDGAIDRQHRSVINQASKI